MALNKTLIIIRRTTVKFFLVTFHHRVEIFRFLWSNSTWNCSH